MSDNYYICPNCQCVTSCDKQKCDGCPMSTLGALAVPNIQLMRFRTVNGMDRWIALMKKTGGKVWRKK